MTESAVERESLVNESTDEVSEDALVSRIAAGRRAGRDTVQDTQALLRLAAKRHRAALDRLAK
ncbi:MAG: hypothetical protein NVS3B21_19270 [Acidimicrobiales bacterium]